MENKFINIKDAAKMLGVSALTLRNWDKSGKFPAGRHPMSNYRVYNVADLEKFMQLIATSTEAAESRPTIKKTAPKADSEPRSSVRKLSVKHLIDSE